MQGGHPDGLRFRFTPSNVETDSGNDSEISVDEPLRLGAKLDQKVLFARETFGTCLALPVAWIQFHPTIESLRAHKKNRVEKGIQTILYIQSFRNPILDILMQIFSFCAEEEFYLIVLPLLFWNGYFDLGEKLTFVVVVGLFIGNIIKDVFELPRPSSPPCWRPKHNLDSTALQDFGFPSTHAMNSVTNSILVTWYFWNDDNKYSLLFFSGYYIFFLCLSRLYLGAHTATDVRGGLGLGVLMIFVYLVFIDSKLRELYKFSSFSLFFGLLFVCSVALLLCPQPRPPTPTFHQNALLAGLLWGLLFGCKLSIDFGLNNEDSYGILKSIFCFILITLMRMIVKTVVTVILEVFLGIKTKPRQEVIQKRSVAKRGKKKIIRLFTRDVDIIAVAVVKTFTYLATALSVTFIGPYCWKEAESFYQNKI